MGWKYWSKHIAVGGYFAGCLLLAALPLRADEIVASGQFYDVHHPTSGRAVLVARDDGGYELRFEDFTSDNGPDIFIYLSTAEEPHTDSAIKNAENTNLGPRQALTGDQTYILPKGVSPDSFKSVAIWCRAYSVMFGAAALERP